MTPRTRLPVILVACFASVVARADSFETNWLSVVRLYQAYAATPMSADHAGKLATHDAGDERANGHFNPVTNSNSYRTKVDVPPLSKAGADFLLMNVPVSAESYDLRRQEMKTGLAAGTELVLGKVLYGSTSDRASCYLTIHVLIDANDLASIPIAEQMFRQLAISGRIRGMVAAQVVSGDLDVRSVSASYYEHKNEFAELPDGDAKNLLVYRLKVRPTSLRISTPPGTLTYASEQVASSTVAQVAPDDPRLAWIDELKKPLPPRLKPKKSPSLLEARQLGELMLDAAKAGDAVTTTKALEEGAYPLMTDQINGGNAVTWLIDGMERKKLPKDDQIASVEVLLRYGVDPNGFGGQIPLGTTHTAEVVKLLVRAGADLNQTYLMGETVLMKVAQRGDVGVLRVLLAAGADPNATVARPKLGSPQARVTAEEIADEAGQRDAVRLLRSFRQNGKSALVVSTESEQSTSAAPSKAAAVFTPSGQNVPQIPGFTR